MELHILLFADFDSIVQISQEYHLAVVLPQHLLLDSMNCESTLGTELLVGCQVNVDELKGLPQNRKLYTYCSLVAHRVAGTSCSQLRRLLELKVIFEGFFE
jgi:hypothetical protein